MPPLSAIIEDAANAPVFAATGAALIVASASAVRALESDKSKWKVHEYVNATSDIEYRN